MHSTVWLKKKDEVKNTQERDREAVGSENVELLRTYFVKCNSLVILFFIFVDIQEIGKKFRQRQRLIATAIVFFKRFYLKCVFPCAQGLTRLGTIS